MRCWTAGEASTVGAAATSLIEEPEVRSTLPPPLLTLHSHTPRVSLHYSACNHIMPVC